jgi:predicted alpha/beta hydrolase family esterase
MTELIFVPGFGGSGPSHWQSLWEDLYPSTRRIQPASWEQPELADWIAALESAVRECAGPPMLVAHSLGCLLVAFWAQHSSLPIIGAFLVAVPDPSTPGFKDSAPTFGNVPAAPLRFPSLIVVSTSDPFDANGYAIAKARDWKSDVCSIGDRGHINGESNLGDWKFGQSLMASFILKCAPSKSTSQPI